MNVSSRPVESADPSPRARHLVHAAVLTLTLASAGCSAHSGAPADPAPKEGDARAEAVEPQRRQFERIAVVGASASAGFGLKREVGRDTALADLLVAAAPEVFDDVLDLGDAFFFVDPDGNLATALEKLRVFRPEVVVGSDVQFWFGYGAKPMSERVPHLLECLTTLESFAVEMDAIVLVGDFPDVRDASFLMMPPHYEPDDATLAELNATVHAWCDEHERFVLVPMAGFVDQIKAGEPIELRGGSFDTEDSGTWLQRDGLHPTLFGTAALALLSLEALARVEPFEGAVTWNPHAVADGVRPPAEEPAAVDAGRDE